MLERTQRHLEDTGPQKIWISLLAMQLMRTVLEMAMESGPARLAMIVAAIAFTQVSVILECLCCLV